LYKNQDTYHITKCLPLQLNSNIGIVLPCNYRTLAIFRLSLNFSALLSGRSKNGKSSSGKTHKKQNKAKQNNAHN